MKLTKAFLMCAATAAFAAMPVYAQDHGAAGHDHAKMDDKAEDMASTPAKFVENAAQGGMYEVESSKLALESKDPKVKEFAQKMIDDHTMANDKLKAIATAKGLTVPTALDAKHQEMVDKLKAAHGTGQGDFDKMYQEQQLKAHEKTVALFEAATKLSDAELSAFAKETLPTLKMHTDMLKGAGVRGGHDGHGGM